ncbi:MAG: Uma2 family endonuclease [Chthonomonadaceae bacterium]|nr:Uma2 family endonuclease [Chthonomonadaceae bacterium]
MSVAIQKKRVSIDGYFEWAETQEGKYEYWDGAIVPLRVGEEDQIPDDWVVEWGDNPLVAMAGGTPEHSELISNLQTLFAVKLFGSGCRHYSSETAVYVAACNQFYYPDISVVCGNGRFDEKYAITNPVGVVEVASQSTQKRDRTRKLSCYQQMPTIQFVLLVSQTEPQIDAYFRFPTNEWIQITVKGLQSTLLLAPINGELKLADVYARVEFREESAD